MIRCANCGHKESFHIKAVSSVFVNHVSQPCDYEADLTKDEQCGCENFVPMRGLEAIISEVERTDRTPVLMESVEECEECGHPVNLHDAEEGCTFERGDSYESGYAPMALGPCGCTAVTFETPLDAAQKERRHLDELYQNDLQRRSGC